MLRDRLKISNFVLLKIPVEIHNLGHGEKLYCIDAERLPEVLGVTEKDVESVSQTGLVCRRPQKPRPKPHIAMPFINGTSSVESVPGRKDPFPTRHDFRLPYLYFLIARLGIRKGPRGGIHRVSWLAEIVGVDLQV